MADNDNNNEVVSLTVETDDEVKVEGDTLSVVVDIDDAVEVFESVANGDKFRVTVHNGNGEQIGLIDALPADDAVQAMYRFCTAGMDDEEIEASLPTIEIEVEQGA